MQNGDVVLVRTFSLLAWLIRKFIKTEYNHAGMVVDGMFYESDKPGIVCRSIADAMAEYKDVIIRRCKYPVDRDLAQNYVKKLPLRRGYDYWNLLLFQPIYRLTGWWFGWQSGAKMTCTEMVARAYGNLFDNPERVSVKEILDNKHFENIELWQQQP